jgi:hypothetical protein
MLSDDIVLVDSLDFYQGRESNAVGDAWERIKSFCAEAQKSSQYTERVEEKSSASSKQDSSCTCWRCMGSEKDPYLE